MSSIYTTIYVTTSNIISERNCTSSNYRSKQTSSLLHTTKVDKPYIAFNSERYITIRQQELRICKRIGYEFYCKELFVVKHKSKYSYISMIYFNLN